MNVPLVFLEHGVTDVFARKNNRTVCETLRLRRYVKFSELICREYASDLDVPLGTFVASLKAKGDAMCRKFLNPHGDKTYCHFRLEPGPSGMGKGLYVYIHGGAIVYVGRSHDPFFKRADQGYGKTHPKNCYIDGQSTNCHLNALIEQQSGDVEFYVCTMADDEAIDATERLLIQERTPPWNVALAR